MVYVRKTNEAKLWGKMISYLVITPFSISIAFTELLKIPVSFVQAIALVLTLSFVLSEIKEMAHGIIWESD